ncbi:alkaline phosphatase family protein [Bradyrhizobium centrosematis]|uniref:alkaline phosphatase family protein n=1 Tax=Bradyrhizobium centrosematis TaxID=1300039 RepID=UPI00388DFBE6
MSDRSGPNRVIIVLFGGLRPDLISPSRTPNLDRLRRRGTMLARQRTIYPSETRVSLTSLITGVTPDRHGIVGNSFLDRVAAAPRLIDTSDDRLVEDLDAASCGHLVGVPSLGEILATNGKTFAVLASNSAGATRLLSHKARSLSQVTLSGHFPRVSTSAAMLERVEARLGPTPAPTPFGTPDLSAQAFVTSALLDEVWPQIQPDVAILSFGEPDTTSHYCGIGATRSLEVIGFLDRQFGRLLEWWESEGAPQGVHLMVASDHGQVTVHAQADLFDTLKATGVRCGQVPGPGIEAVVLSGQVGAIYLSEPSDRAICRTVAAMMERPWCGPVLTAARCGEDGIAPGSLARHLVFADHPRSADILFSYRADDGLDPFGFPGHCWSPNWPVGLGVHGGLHPKEMSSLAILAGPLIRSGVESHVPSNICDFAPTVLSLLGISRPSTMSGRVLAEALIFGAKDPQTIETVHTARAGGYRQELRRVQVGSTIYVDSASVV